MVFMEVFLFLIFSLSHASWPWLGFFSSLYLAICHLHAAWLLVLTEFIATLTCMLSGLYWRNAGFPHDLPPYHSFMTAERHPNIGVHRWFFLCWMPCAGRKRCKDTGCTAEVPSDSHRHCLCLAPCTAGFRLHNPKVCSVPEFCHYPPKERPLDGVGARTLGFP